MKQLLGLCGLLLYLAAGCGLYFLGAEIKLPEVSLSAEEEEEPWVMPLENGYYYRKLPEEEKALYDTMYEALLYGRMETVLDGKIAQTVLEGVFWDVLADHPELFYTDGFVLTDSQMEGIAVKRTFSGNILYTEEEIRIRMERMERKTREILKEAGRRDGEYEKVRFIYEYIVKNTEYVLDSPDDQNICSVLLNGESVCQGYAKTMQYLLKRLGMEAVLVFGTVNGGQEHAWNIVQIDGDYYHVDVTWGDASYIRIHAEPEEEKNTDQNTDQNTDRGQKPQINYEYFCVPDQQFFITHTPDADRALPECGSMRANYYVREGLYFETADMERVKSLFEWAYQEKQECVTLKCAGEETYRELEEMLIERQRVFACLPEGADRIAYTANEKQLTLSFWMQD